MGNIPSIKVITVKRACEILAEAGMSITPVKMNMGLRQRVYPFGDAVEMSSEWSYAVYEHLLRKWIVERSEINEA